MTAKTNMYPVILPCGHEITEIQVLVPGVADKYYFTYSHQFHGIKMQENRCPVCNTNFETEIDGSV